ncbi:hypothetical protein [Dysgonomonas sp. 511]|uniref:phage head spike fiber domain-containing protein n=1 Tax=Dysgonomonas sp. 511 TaxID=2302930 RepID=UPI0013D4CFF7|nr:hypothetical protein [Dysgonomonas sp. 511]
MAKIYIDKVQLGDSGELSRDKINENFDRMNDSVDSSYKTVQKYAGKIAEKVTDVSGKIEGLERFKGYFENENLLKSAYPEPKVGDYAYVGSPFPGTVWICRAKGRWDAGGYTPKQPVIELNGYAKKDQLWAADVFDRRYSLNGDFGDWKSTDNCEIYGDWQNEGCLILSANEGDGISMSDTILSNNPTWVMFEVRGDGDNGCWLLSNGLNNSVEVRPQDDWRTVFFHFEEVGKFSLLKQSGGELFIRNFYYGQRGNWGYGYIGKRSENAFSDLEDVEISNPKDNDITVFSGGKWMNRSFLRMMENFGFEVTALNYFIDNLSSLGVQTDATILKEGFKQLNPFILANAEAVLFPGAYNPGLLYGMNPRTGALSQFSFSRATGATVFDKNLDMQMVEADMPRIDFGNYNREYLSGDYWQINENIQGYYDKTGVFIPSENIKSIIIEDVNKGDKFAVKNLSTGGRQVGILGFKTDGTFIDLNSVGNNYEDLNQVVSIIEGFFTVPEGIYKIAISTNVGGSFQSYPYYCYKFKDALGTAKILIEKEATNLADYSTISDKPTGIYGTYIKEIGTLNWFNFILNGVRYPIITDPKTYYMYRGFSDWNVGDVYRYSVYTKLENNEKPKILNIQNINYDAGWNFGGGSARNNSPVTDNLKDNIYRIGNNINVVTTPINTGLMKYGSNRQLSDMLISGVQIEKGGISTSYIPTTDSQVTRAADLLSYTLTNPCSIYLKTTKQNVVLEKPAGTWNIHEDLDNEGILQLAVFDRIIIRAKREKNSTM